MHDDVTTVTTCVTGGVSVPNSSNNDAQAKKKKKKVKNRKNKKKGRQHDAGDHLSYLCRTVVPNQVVQRRA